MYCDSPPIKSHSIQRNGALRDISENSHVYQFGPGRVPVPLWKVPTLISTRTASIFPGFCENHDHDLFRSIESLFDVEDRGHLCLLFYRALCIELHKKEFSLHTFELALQQSKRKNIEHIRAVREGTLKGISDLNRIREIVERHLHEGILLDLSGIIVEFEDHLPFTFTGVFAPFYDFSGGNLRIGTSIYDPWSGIFVFAGRIGGKNIFFAAGISEAGVQDIERFFSTFLLHHESLRSAYVLNLGLTHLENSFFKVSWFDSLAAREKDYIRGKLREGGNFGPMNQYALIPEVKINTARHRRTISL